MTRTGIPLALVVLALATGRPTVAQEPETPPSAATAAELEQQFEDTMMGARLIGHFTVTGAGSENLPRPDSYTVSRISKLEDGRWLFEASMSYGDNAVAIPMPFDVVWAGDTPVITLTDQTIPGLGTFSARVLIYEGEYAGTWKHGAFGGHMWGRIETGDEATEPPQTDPAP